MTSEKTKKKDPFVQATVSGATIRTISSMSIISGDEIEKAFKPHRQEIRKLSKTQFFKPPKFKK